MSRIKIGSVSLLAVVLSLVFLASQASAVCVVVPRAQVFEGEFTRLAATTADPNGNSVAANCGGDYLGATATFQVTQENASSKITIHVENGRPNSYLTVWLRLAGVDAEGNSFGRSPLTNGDATALAPSTALDELTSATGTGNGRSDLANGFFTDANGEGTLVLNLDFPIFGGAYPFHRFQNFDPTDPHFPIPDPNIYPVPIVVPGDGSVTGGFALRIVSHCTDEVGHGLMPGPHEPWFDWPE